MANNTSSGRFYPFTANLPATFPSIADLPDHRYRRDSSGSDSVSGDDRGAIVHFYSVERTAQGQGVLREPFGEQDVSGFIQNHTDPASTNIYVDDPPYIPTDPFRTAPLSNFIQPGPDVHFGVLYQHFDLSMPPQMTTTTPHGTPYGHGSGDNSPTGSHGSGRSDGSGGMSGSSHGSASIGVTSYGPPLRDPAFHGHQVFAPQQRVEPTPAFNPEHYPAYDEHRRRIGMEHARFGVDPRQPEQAYYRPRTHTYPPVGAHGMAPGMDSPELVQSSNFPSPDLQMIPMGPQDLQSDHDAPVDSVIPGQTRIHLPSSNAPRYYDDSPYPDDPPNAIFSGDDAVYNTTDTEIRHILGLDHDQELSLETLADPPQGQRPGQSIPVLSQLAILGSPNKRLTLQGIYEALEERFEWFRQNRHDKSWQNSIRHNLSLYKCFRRQSKPITEPGKGSYWVVDYSKGSGTKRPRKRRRGKDGSSQQLPSQENPSQQTREEDSETEESCPSPIRLSQEIPIDPQLQAQGHQVGQGRSRFPSASSSRSIARRGNSPYSQNPQSGSQGRFMRQSARPTQMMGQGNVPGMRNPSNPYGGHPAFGQPSMAPPGYGHPLYEHPGMGTRSAPAGWQTPPALPTHTQSLQFLPSPNTLAMGPLPPPQPQVAGPSRVTPARSYTLPANIAHELSSSQYSLAQPPPRQQIYDPARDVGVRYIPRGDAQQQAPGGYAQYYPSSRSRDSGSGGRRTSSSSGSSRSRE